MKTKFLTPFLVLARLLSVPATAQVNYAVSGDTAYVTSSPDASGDIVIASTYNGYPVTSVGSGAFYNCSGLTNISIPNSVTSIEDDAFSRCASLTNVDIPSSVTSIGSRAFTECINLTGVSIPNSVSSIRDGAFWGCTSLTSVTILDTVAVIGDAAFAWCTSLTSVSIPNSVTNIGPWAFLTCASLASVTIGNGVTSIGESAFRDCWSLTNLLVDAANPAYSSLDGVLFDKAQSRLIAFPAGRAGSYVIPNGVLSLRNDTFDACAGLTSVTIPDSVLNIEDGYAIGDLTPIGCFTQCLNLTNVIIPNSVTNIGNYAFYHDGNLTKVTMKGGVTRIGFHAFADCYSLADVNLREGITTIETGAFSACRELTSVVIPATVASIGYAFYNSFNLTNLTFLGDAPFLLGGSFDVFDRGTMVYYNYGTTGWGQYFGSLPTMMLGAPAPQIGPASANVKPGGFGFTLTGVVNQTIMVEASTNLVDWQPIWINTLSDTAAEFFDPEWLNLPHRFYRTRSN